MSDPRPARIPILVAENHALLQLRLLDISRMSHFLFEKGFPQYSRDNVRLLWDTGLLRADVVTSPRKTEAGLTYLAEHSKGTHLYADERPIQDTWRLWCSREREQQASEEGLEPLFHPFRVFVLARLHRIFADQMHPLQFIISQNGFVNMQSRILARLQNRLEDPEFFRLVTELNDLASLAILSEPCAGEQVFGRFSRGMWVDENTQRSRIEEHFKTLARLYETLEMSHIEDARERFCRDAESLEPNRMVHTVFRLGSSQILLDLKGHLGAAVTILMMAEVLRRVAERVFGNELREEDELAFGMPLAGTKEENYGSRRLFDGDRQVAREYLRSVGLDGGVRLKWYVEGETELGALRAYFGFWPAVELVHLGGRVVEKKILAFRDSLRNDINAGVFSFVSVDADRDEYVRAVRQAARDDEICGLFFLSDRDFEFGNFTIDELEEILLASIPRERRANASRVALHEAIHSVRSARDLFRQAGMAVPELLGFGKGELWGERLMDFAVTHQTWREGEARPIVEALKFAHQTPRVGHARTRKLMRVNPETGRLERRAS